MYVCTLEWFSNGLKTRLDHMHKLWRYTCPKSRNPDTQISDWIWTFWLQKTRDSDIIMANMKLILSKWCSWCNFVIFQSVFWLKLWWWLEISHVQREYDRFCVNVCEWGPMSIRMLLIMYSPVHFEHIPLHNSLLKALKWIQVLSLFIGKTMPAVYCTRVLLGAK